MEDPVTEWELQYLPAIETHMREGRLDSVIIVCQLGLQEDSTRIVLYNLMASAYATQRRFEPAVAALQKAVRLAPEFTEGWVNLGGIHTRLGKFAEAIPYLEQAASLDSNQAAAQRRLGEVYLYTDAYEKAASAIRTAMGFLPDDATLTLLLGRTQEKLSKKQNALASYLLSGKLDPGYFDAHTRAALLARSLGQAHVADSLAAVQVRLSKITETDEEALSVSEQLRTALTNAPEDAITHARMGGFFLYHNYLPEALVLFERATRLEPDNTWLMNEFGGLLSRRGNGEEALVFYERSLLADPEYGPALINAGGILNALGRNKEALAYFQRALVLSPGDPGVRFFIGVTYISLGDYNEARKSLEQALSEVGDTSETVRQQIQAALDSLPD
jgi:tetratricopeptide (TPR) repeat protein